MTLNSNFLKEMEQNLMEYMEYLYSNGCTLDANGNIVPLNNNENEKKLIFTKPNEEDYE